jgi:hypothetical protein
MGSGLTMKGNGVRLDNWAFLPIKSLRHNKVNTHLSSLTLSSFCRPCMSNPCVLPTGTIMSSYWPLSGRKQRKYRELCWQDINKVKKHLAANA